MCRWSTLLRKGHLYRATLLFHRLSRGALQAEDRCRAAAEAALAVERRAAAVLSTSSRRSRRARLAPTLATLQGAAQVPGPPHTLEAVPCADVAGPPPEGCGPAAGPGEQGATAPGGMPQALAGAVMAHALPAAGLLEGSGEAGCAGISAGEPNVEHHANACGSCSASPERSACGRAHASAASHASCAAGSRSRAHDDGCLRPARSGAAAAGAGRPSAAPASSAADGGSTADCSEYASALASPESACGSAAARDEVGAGAGGGSGPHVHGMCAAARRAGDWEAGACAAKSEGLGQGSGPAAGPADADVRRRAAEAEAAAARLSAALTAAAQRVKAREEQCRRLQAQLGHAQLRLVRSSTPAHLGAWAHPARSSRAPRPLTRVGLGACSGALKEL